MQGTELDQAIVECMGDPDSLAFGNEVIDIITARQRGEITEFEAQYLLMEMRDVRAAQSLASNETAARWVYTACTLALKVV